MNQRAKRLKDTIESESENFREQVQADHWRLHYHVMPPTGWLNDPNGVCQFRGLYHLFYQYSPIDANGALKYWGHKTSKDMVHFEDQDIALYPDQPYDIDGVYSGSAFIENDQLHFFYTGNVRHKGDHNYITSGREQNTIHVTSPDGFTLNKQGVVIGADQYPERFTQHIRDPKIFKKDNHYYMILGARNLEDQGEVLLYKSTDLKSWSYQGIFVEHQANMGYMWECPDFFELNGQEVLLISPQGMDPLENQFHNVYQSGYFIGNTDWEQQTFKPLEPFVELDCGFDFYAPQTFEDESGRRILWGWMGLPDIEPEYSNPTIEHGWQHAMTLPRELIFEDGKLLQRPLIEYEKLRKELSEMNIHVDGKTEVNGLQGEVYEMFVTFHEIGEIFTVQLRKDMTISYHKEDQLLTLSLGASGYGRKERKTTIENLTNLHIFSDTSSLELFVNDGEKVFTTRTYPTPKKGSDIICFGGSAKINVKKWSLQKTS